MPRKAVKSPQQKKALNYAKDHKDAGYFSDKGWRKTRRRKKVRGNRTTRHAVAQKLSQVVSPDDADVAETQVRAVRRKNAKESGGWPVPSMGEWVKERIEKRELRHGARKGRMLLKQNQ